MQTLIKILLSPLAFAVGFVWPLLTQSLIAAELLQPDWTAVAAGAVIALVFGLMAQLRGSWIWIK